MDGWIGWGPRELGFAQSSQGEQGKSEGGCLKTSVQEGASGAARAAEPAEG